jgi:choice-of-anchor B domain-containing protein
MKQTLLVAVVALTVLFISAIGTVQAVPFSTTIDSLTGRPDSVAARNNVQASTSVDEAMLADPNFQLCLKGAIQIGVTHGGTNCWGWYDTTDGREYAIMGVATGIAFVDVNTMQVKDIIPGPVNGCGNILWREIKTYKQYCYAVSECTGTNQGMMIMDMSFLPDSVKFVRSYSTATDIRAHTISIDTVKGFVYLVKQNYSGFRVISLANPTNPTEVGFVATGDLHDMTANNDTVWAAEANLGTFSVWNMANKTSPVLIDRISIPSSGYVHNIWPTKDGKYLGTTEETANKTVKIWDIQDIHNISLVSEYLGPSDLAHNIHMQDGKAFLSHYESGISVLNMADPLNPTEIGRYDTYASGDAALFNGCWGIFPHTRTGKVYASNMDGRLFVFLTRSTQLPDTLKVASVASQPSEQVAVDISVTNDVNVKGFLLPIDWTGPYGLIFDSASTAGLRTSYFEDFNYLGYDVANSRIAVEMRASSVGSSPDLPPGSGPVLRLYFTVPSGATGDSNQVRLSPYVAPNTIYPSLLTECFTLQVPLQQGKVTLGGGACCVDRRGNVNNSVGDAVDISDLSLLIAFLTTQDSGIVFECPAEANVDGSLNGMVDLSDLSLMISFLTVTPKPALPLCP